MLRLLYYVCTECDQEICAAQPEATSWRTRHCRICGRLNVLCNHPARERCQEPAIVEHWQEYPLLAPATA